jgi:predicted ATPase
MGAPYLAGLRTVPERVPPELAYPFHLRCLRELDLTFARPVTFFAGENGTGKSTLLEAIAALARLPVSGGGRNELAGDFAPDNDSPLARALRPAFRKRPPDGYFLRAEFQAHFASLLDERKADPAFQEHDPYMLYGGKSLHQRSHGEAFLAVLQNRIRSGFFLLDEPEAALSPLRQLGLLALMYDLTATGDAQFIIATHSPILLTYPAADIVSFDGDKLSRVELEQTSHYQITRGILENPERYWKHLREGTSES